MYKPLRSGSAGLVHVAVESKSQDRGTGKPAGDIALIRGRELHVIEANEPYQFSTGDQFSIVSDAYVKWRGGPMPSVAEEPKVCHGPQRSHRSSVNRCNWVCACLHVSVWAMCWLATASGNIICCQSQPRPQFGMLPRCKIAMHQNQVQSLLGCSAS